MIYCPPDKRQNMTLILSWTVVKYLLAELSPPSDPFTDMAEYVCGF